MKEVFSYRSDKRGMLVILASTLLIVAVIVVGMLGHEKRSSLVIVMGDISRADIPEPLGILPIQEPDILSVDKLSEGDLAVSEDKTDQSETQQPTVDTAIGNSASNVQVVADDPAPVQPVAEAVSKPKAVAVSSSGPLVQRGFCYVFPAYLRPYLSRDPLPDGADYKGHSGVCHVIADGKKDHPGKSGKNHKGHNGGACRDWDEVPNIHACYTDQYWPELNNFVKNNPLDSIKKKGLVFEKFK
ncbi:hypothetical protein HGB24_02700 [Candidatus Saccharibacteria bacterium]|nr:hypothetical protein [Candidatus Saccharibacteria bacterium]